MYKYELHYLSDLDNAYDKHYESDYAVHIGDVIEPAEGSFHCVVKMHRRKTGMLLDVSRSAQNVDEALLAALQLGHL